MVVMQPCGNCEAHIPKAIGVGREENERLHGTVRVVTNYCPVCGEPTDWGEEYKW